MCKALSCEVRYLPAACLRAGVGAVLAPVEAMHDELIRLEGEDEALESHETLPFLR